MMIEPVKTENFILSLITQAVRAFNRADDFEDILKIVLIGVTAGSGLGFNRAFILLTCDQQKSFEDLLFQADRNIDFLEHFVASQYFKCLRLLPETPDVCRQ